MKKLRIAVFVVTLLFFTIIWASRSEEEVVPQTETVPTETTLQITEPTLPQLTKQDILDLFNGYAYADPDNKQAVDCVAVTDSAFGLLAVVLYTTDDYDGCSLDYISREGACVGRIGIGAAPAEEPQLTYLGDGALSCQLVHTDGKAYLCKIFYISNEEGTYFRVEG